MILYLSMLFIFALAFFGAFGARAPFGGSGRAFSLEVGSFALTKKFPEAPGALRTRFFARPGSLGLDFGFGGRSRPRFWRAQWLDFRGLSALMRVRCELRANSTKHCKN